MPRDDAGFTVKEEEVAWRIVNPVSLHHKPIPERSWIVHDWIPRGVVTALYADGGVGKTLLAMMLQVACGISASWCGLAVEPCRSFALYCEDDEPELHRRGAKICDHYRTGFDQLEDVRWISGVGCDNALAEPDEGFRMRMTSRLIQLEKGIQDHDAGLAILDVAADLFLGNENDRGMVRQFIGLLNGMAMRRNCAVLLNAHPSRAGLHSGEIDGASTAWNNSVRSRMSLERVKTEKGEEADTDARVLTRRKANYAPLGASISLRWENGMLVPVQAPTGLAALARDKDAEAVFLALLARFEAEGRRVSDNSRSGNYAPKEFSERPDRQGLSKRTLECAMQRLFVAGKIIMAEYGKASGSTGVRPRQIVLKA